MDPGKDLWERRAEDCCLTWICPYFLALELMKCFVWGSWQFLPSVCICCLQPVPPFTWLADCCLFWLTVHGFGLKDSTDTNLLGIPLINCFLNYQSECGLIFVAMHDLGYSLAEPHKSFCIWIITGIGFIIFRHNLIWSGIWAPESSFLNFWANLSFVMINS